MPGFLGQDSGVGAVTYAGVLGRSLSEVIGLSKRIRVKRQDPLN